jgi:AraC-like ligand binding domain
MLHAEVEMTLDPTVAFLDVDANYRPATALQMEVKEYKAEIPVHRHRKSQLVLALHGAVTCQVAKALWMAPPHCGVWIPGGLPHSNRATANARLCYLFVEPGIIELPQQMLYAFDLAFGEGDDPAFGKSASELRSGGPY